MNCFYNADILYYFWGVLAFVNLWDHVFQQPFPALKFKRSDYASLKVASIKKLYILAKRSAERFLNYFGVFQGGKVRYREREWSL